MRFGRRVKFRRLRRLCRLEKSEFLHLVLRAAIHPPLFLHLILNIAGESHVEVPFRRRPSIMSGMKTVALSFGLHDSLLIANV